MFKVFLLSALLLASVLSTPSYAQNVQCTVQSNGGTAILYKNGSGRWTNSAGTVGQVTWSRTNSGIVLNYRVISAPNEAHLLHKVGSAFVAGSC